MPLLRKETQRGRALRLGGLGFFEAIHEAVPSTLASSRPGSAARPYPTEVEAWVKNDHLGFEVRLRENPARTDYCVACEYTAVRAVSCAQITGQ